VAELPNRIVLVGFMGAGKSVVGARLAQRLGYRFEDMDRRIEKRTGRSIRALFEERGEEAFREEEEREAASLAQLDRRVIATGGGAFARPQTRARLQDGAVTVWIRVDFDTVIERIRPDGTRPLAGNRGIMRTLLAEREPSYCLANLVVDTARGTTPAGVAERIVDLIEKRAARENAAKQ
jgi:shikimate kinase